MTTLIEYVAIYAPWIYLLCGLTALYQIYRLWNVRAERRQAVFSLERAKATQEIQSIFSIALLLLVAMGSTYFVSTTLALAVEPTISTGVNPNNAGPEIILPTPTNTAEPTTPTPLPTVLTQPISVTVTNTPAPTPTSALPTPTATSPPVVQSANCPNPGAIITSPGENAVLRGLSVVLGTATHEQFQYYKVEYAAPGTEGWTYLGGGQGAVVNGSLVTFNSQDLPNGSWMLRLVVVDQTGNFPDPCQVTVQVQN